MSHFKTFTDKTFMARHEKSFVVYKKNNEEFILIGTFEILQDHKFMDGIFF